MKIPMKCRALVGAILVLCLPLPSAFPQGRYGKIFKGVGTALENRGGLAALTAAGAVVTTYTVKDYMDRQVDNGEGLYSVQMDLDPNAHAIYWARWWGYPNIIPLLQIEGSGEYLVPKFFPSFKGGSVVWTFKVPKIVGGRKINVVIFDDKSDQNAALNGFLRSKASGHFNPEISVSEGVKTPGLNVFAAVKAKLSTGGELQVLASDQPDLPLIEASPICSYLVECPNPWFSSKWDTEGELHDSDGNVVGHIRLSQLGKK